MNCYDGYGNVVVISGSGAGKPFAGKKWAVLGDSISMSHADSLYHKRIAGELGFAVQNLAASGEGYAQVRDAQVPAIASDVDLITVMCGTNDMSAGSNPGSAADTVDSGTFCGTVHDTILKIQERFPEVPLGIITPVNRVDTTQYKNWVISISRAIKGVCDQHSVPCFDLNACSGVLGFTAENIAHYYDDSGCHPNDAGHGVMAAKLLPFVKSLMGI